MSQQKTFRQTVFKLFMFLFNAPIFAIDKEGRQTFVKTVEHEFSIAELGKARERIADLEREMADARHSALTISEDAKALARSLLDRLDSGIKEHAIW